MYKGSPRSLEVESCHAVPQRGMVAMVIPEVGVAAPMGLYKAKQDDDLLLPVFVAIALI